MSKDGYYGVKSIESSGIDFGTVDFSTVDQKGRKIGYEWSISIIDTVVMSEEERLENSPRGYFEGQLVRGDLLSKPYEIWTTPTRDGAGYGPAFNTMRFETLEQARKACDKRIAAARKANAKKFAACNVTENAG